MRGDVGAGPRPARGAMVMEVGVAAEEVNPREVHPDELSPGPRRRGAEVMEQMLKAQEKPGGGGGGHLQEKDRQVEIDVHTGELRRRNPMSDSVSHGLDDLINGGGSDVDSTQDDTNRAGWALLDKKENDLFFFASIGDAGKVARLLHGSGGGVGVDPNVKNVDEQTAMHLAAEQGNLKCVELLIGTGANVNAVDRWEGTPMSCAVEEGHMDVVRLLMGYGGKVTEGGRLVDINKSTLLEQVMLRHMEVTSGGRRGINQWEIPAEELTEPKRGRKLLGIGSFGEVQRRLWRGTEVAVKRLTRELDNTALAEFRAELETCRLCHHPNVVQFLGATTLRPPYAIVTEYMQGGSLSDLLRKHHTFKLGQALHMLLDCARGMAYLHSRKPKAVIHRDLKPANLLLTLDGRLKIADFGLSRTMVNSGSKRVGDQLLSQTYLMTGETGSYRYMAPEVFRHERYGTAVDVFAFGIIAFQILQNCTPYEGFDPVEAARACALEDFRPTFVDPINSELKAIIQHCWHSDPGSRPKFVDIVDRLDNFLHENTEFIMEQTACRCTLQ